MRRSHSKNSLHTAVRAERVAEGGLSRGIWSHPIDASHPHSMSDRFREETSELLEDYIHHYLGNGCQAAPSPAAQTLRRVAAEMLDINRPFYESCDKIPGNPRAVLQTVAAQMPEEGGLNWGRIVSLIVFTAILAKRARVQNTATPKELAEVLTQFLAGEHRDWLQTNGGWAGFHKYFNNKEGHQSQENSSVSGALVAAAGFGLAGLALLLAVR
ncbi:bcl-2-like protein 10 [Spea bombifrons]|uniref:bcl-2-like protein 10 n=1 Tax=Spea bombifrons TaxID=233779 RepID=UPI00234BBF6B|nr:bcl-2-like protein 10 [Spea bombifrons]